QFAVGIDLGADKALETDHLGNFFEIVAEGVLDANCAPADAIVPGVESRDRADIEHAQSKFGASAETCRVVGIDSANADHEIGLANMPVHVNRRAERGLADPDGVAVRIVEKHVARCRSLTPDLEQHRFGARFTVRAAGDYDGDVLWGNTGASKLFQKRRYDPAGGCGTVDVVRDYEWALAAFAELSQGRLAGWILES